MGEQLQSLIRQSNMNLIGSIEKNVKKSKIIAGMVIDSTSSLKEIQTKGNNMLQMMTALSKNHKKTQKSMNAMLGKLRQRGKRRRDCEDDNVEMETRRFVHIAIEEEYQFNPKISFNQFVSDWFYGDHHLYESTNLNPDWKKRNRASYFRYKRLAKIKRICLVLMMI